MSYDWQKEGLGETVFDLVKKRDPDQYDWGYMAENGMKRWGSGWFSSEKELLEFVIECESQFNTMDEKDQSQMKRLKRHCDTHGWKANESLLDEVNGEFEMNHEIMWWGSFKKEMSDPDCGWFAEMLEPIAEKKGQSLANMMEKGLTKEDKAAFKKAIATYGENH